MPQFSVPNINPGDFFLRALLKRKPGAFLFVLFFLFLPGNTLQAAPFNPAYEITAAYQITAAETGQIQGNIKITLLNPSSKPLTAVPLILYPNRFSVPPASLPPEIFKKSFPKPFSPGGIEISHPLDSFGRLLDIQHPETDLGPKTVCLILLKEPLHSGEFTTFTLDFTTTIPERLGVFGRFKSVISLEGGWHPYLPDFTGGAWQFHTPPPRSDFTVNISYPASYDLNHTGTLISRSVFDDHKMSRLHSAETEFFSLVFSTRYSEMITKEGPYVIDYSYFSKDKKYARQVIQLTEEASRFFEETYGPSKPSLLRMAEAYLYEDLYSEGEGILLVSHTLYKIFFPLKKYHDARLLHGIFAHLWRTQIPWEKDWVIEMLSDYSSQVFLNKRLSHPLEGLEKNLKPFAFFPAVDEMLYSPNPSFRQIFFKEAKPLRFRETIRLFNTSRVEGTGILFKLQSLLGREKTLEIVSDYLEAFRKGEQPSFISISEAVSGQNLQWFYQQWLNTFPEPDFGIDNIQDDFKDKTHTTTVSVSKKGEGIEPLTVKAEFSDRTTQEINHLFTGPSDLFVFKSASPVKRVLIDPDHQTNDPSLLNNSRPPKWKFLLDKFNGALDLNTHTPEIEIGGSFRRLYDDNNVFGIYYYRNLEARGVRGDFTHIFPKSLNDHLIQTLGGNYRGEVVMLPGQEDEARGTFGLIYQISYFNYSLAFESNLQFTGPEHPFNGKIYFDYSNGIEWSPYHTLRFKTHMAESNGPLYDPFLGGGQWGLRGYTETALTGSEVSIFSVDYAFPLYYDLDQNLLGISLLHTLQGTFFVDTGNASNEKNLFLFHQYQSDFGGGLILEFDLLGAYPTSLALQMAYPIEPFLAEERNIHYYLNLGTHF
ncbi:MAG: gluzincin family metallopeptidase [Nitrospiria bacterium]